MDVVSSNSSTCGGGGSSSKENNRPVDTIDEPKVSIHERMKLFTSSFEKIKNNNEDVDNSKEVSPTPSNNKIRVQRRNLIRFQTQVRFVCIKGGCDLLIK